MDFAFTTRGQPDADPDDPVPLPSRVGRYQVRRSMGAAGWGERLEAWDERRIRIDGAQGRVEMLEVDRLDPAAARRRSARGSRRDPPPGT